MMPEGYRRELIHPAVDAKIPKMSAFEANGQLIKITCTWCKLSHWYFPGDLRIIFGDVGFRDIENRFRCQKCGKKEYLKADIELPSAKERVGMKVRRLVAIKIIRRPVWTETSL